MKQLTTQSMAEELEEKLFQSHTEECEESALLRENSAEVFQYWMWWFLSSAVLYTSWLHSASYM